MKPEDLTLLRRHWLTWCAAPLLGCATPTPELPAPASPPPTPPAPVPSTPAAAAPAPPIAPIAPEPVVPAPSAPPVPAPALEWRAAWVATVANIDWPSKRGLPAAVQQAEIRQICEGAAQIGLNALILQVRAAADALYPSALEPWAETLTGSQGQSPGYDPLATWITEAHARGLQLHAWFNPYRARHAQAKSPASPLHVSRTRPEWLRSYGDLQWIDPGEPGAAEHTVAVVRDVLSRYEVDGVHLDDYFYPYPVTDPATKAEIDFPDGPSWQRALDAGTLLSRADWRRDNVNRLVQRLYALVREVRPQAQFGISPFGLPRPDARPAGITGFSQVDKLYADVELWLREGWLDYLAPQLYWPRAQREQAFEPLLRAWHALNPLGKPIYPGLFSSRINGNADSWQAEEIVGQIDVTRRVAAELGVAAGHAHFSWVALGQNRRRLADRLRQDSYAKRSMNVPAG